MAWQARKPPAALLGKASFPTVDIARLSELRPRTVWDIIDDAFDLYRERFVALCAVSAVVGAPAYVARLAFQTGPYAKFLRATFEKSAEDSGEAFLHFLGALLLALPLLIAAQTLQTGAVAAVVEDYLRGQRSISVRGAYKRLFARTGTVLLAALLVGLLWAAGLCAMGIGTLYCWIVFAFVGQTLVIERRGIWAALRRSRMLVLTSQGRVFGMLLLLLLLPTLLSSGLVAIVMLAFSLSPSGGDVGEQQIQQQMLGQVVESLVGVVLAPLQAIALTLLYYDIRVRQEGFDIVAQAEATGVTLAPDPFGEQSSERAATRVRRDAQRAARTSRPNPPAPGRLP